MVSRRLNLLAMPKEPAFMRAFVARAGTVLMQADLSAVEPRVLTHFSQDPTFLKIYGPNAWLYHDVYMLAGLKVPGLGPQIAALYSLENPTLEGVKAAKTKFAKERKTLLKPAMLGWQYGIGKDTLAINLEITTGEAATILRAMDKQFPGRKILHKRLENEWGQRGGYIINGRGRPLPVDFGKKRDLVSRLCQSTGHDCLVRILYHMNNYRKEHKVGMTPYLVDMHDESVWAVEEHEIERARECFNYAFDRLNDEISWTVQLIHSGINFGPDLRVRCEGWDNESQSIIAA